MMNNIDNADLAEFMNAASGIKDIVGNNPDAVK